MKYLKEQKNSFFFKYDTNCSSFLSVNTKALNYSVIATLFHFFVFWRGIWIQQQEKNYLHFNTSSFGNDVTPFVQLPMSVWQRLQILCGLLNFLRQQIPLRIQQIQRYHWNWRRPRQLTPIHTLQTATFLLQFILVCNPILKILKRLHQFLVNIREPNPVPRFGLPAIPHEFADEGGTVVGRYQHDALQDQFDYLLVGVAVIGLLAETVDLPQDDAVGPNVRFEGEAAVEDALGGHPPNWQQSRAANLRCGNMTIMETQWLSVKRENAKPG